MPYVKYIKFNTIHLKVSDPATVFQLKKVSIYERVYFAHETLIRCDI
jgi:hypothetical protein